MLIPDFSTLSAETLMFYSVIFISIIRIIWLFLQYSKLAFFKEKTGTVFSPPVSVIICARNEGENLTKFLPEILTQDYEDYEVIVVNDCSSDNTDDVLREFSKVFPNLKGITVKEDDYYKHGKKFALMVGIKGAKNDYLVLTDGDCKPSSSLWLKKMASGFAGEKEIVLGYGAYLPDKGLLNKLIRYDTFLIGLNYLSAAMRNKPYMGVGRNLAYKKDLFFKSKNFSKHYHLISGDDDLFINQVATASNTQVIIDKDAFTYSIPKKNWRDWKRQKARHLTTAPYYNSQTKTRLGTEIFISLFFWIVLILAFIPESTRLTALSSLIVTWSVQAFIYINAAKRLNEKNVVSLFLILDVILIIAYPIFHFSKRFFQPNKWMN